jgi:hypothetical protein
LRLFDLRHGTRRDVDRLRIEVARHIERRGIEHDACAVVVVVVVVSVVVPPMRGSQVAPERQA